MSWDAWLISDDGVDLSLTPHGCRVVTRRIIGEWNYTSNTNPMVRATGCDWPRDFAGLDGPDGAAYLHRVISMLENDPLRFEAMNPPNGWGDYDTLLDVLREMRAAVPEQRCTWAMVW